MTFLFILDFYRQDYTNFKMTKNLIATFLQSYLYTERSFYVLSLGNSKQSFKNRTYKSKQSSTTHVCSILTQKRTFCQWNVMIVIPEQHFLRVYYVVEGIPSHLSIGITFTNVFRWRFTFVIPIHEIHKYTINCRTIRTSVSRWPWFRLVVV